MTSGGSSKLLHVPTPNKNACAQNLLREDYVHSGFLRKLNPNKAFNWSASPRPPNYVILHSGCVYHFEHEASRTPKGVFSLLGYNMINRCRNLENPRQPWVFQIVHSHSSGTTHLFSAPSEKDMVQWIRLIKEEMLRVNGRTDELNKLIAEDHRACGDGEEEHGDSVFESPRSEHRRYSSPNRNSTGSSSIDVGYGSDQCLNSSTSPVSTPSHGHPPHHLAVHKLNNNNNSSGSQPSRSHSFLSIIRRQRRLSIPKVPPPALPNKEELDDAGGCMTLRGSPQLTSSQSTGALNSLSLRVQPLGESNDQSQKVKPQKPPKPTKLALLYPNDSDSGLVTNLSLSSAQTSYWDNAFMPDLDKDQAAIKLRDLGQEGVYIVRNSESAFKVLTVYSQGRIRKLKIFEDCGSFFFVEGDSFASMEELLRFYMNKDIANLGITLTVPYRQAVPDNLGITLTVPYRQAGPDVQ